MPIPKVTDYLNIAAASGSVEDRANDYERGSDFESLSGPNAILWSRQSQRDLDMWKSTRFADAEGPELTALVEGRYGIPRVRDTRGRGTARFVRATTAGGAGTIWRGTRITTRSNTGLTQNHVYRVRQDVPVSSTATAVDVPIEAVEYGPGVKYEQGGVVDLRDPLWDNTWSVVDLTCSDGTRLEKAADYRARVIKERKAARVGQELGIRTACLAVGAAHVALFRSDFRGSALDDGLNYVYVGDTGHSANPSLVRACTLALRGARVGGDHCQVLPMARATRTISANIYLRDGQARSPVSRIDELARKALIQYMDGPAGKHIYTVVGMESAIAKVSRDIQDVEVFDPTTDSTFIPGQSVLNRYFTTDADIFLTFKSA